MSALPAASGPAEVVTLSVPPGLRRHHRHPVIVEVDFDDLQAAHEKMHPDGSLFIESCCELICRHLRGAA